MSSFVKNKTLIYTFIIFIKHANIVYERALDYLQKHFNFDESYLKNFKCRNLDQKLDFRNVEKILKVINVNLDFDEFAMKYACSIKFLIYLIKKIILYKKWCYILNMHNFFNLLIIVKAVFSIRKINDYAERIFSVIILYLLQNGIKCP